MILNVPVRLWTIDMQNSLNVLGMLEHWDDMHHNDTGKVKQEEPGNGV